MVKCDTVSAGGSICIAFDTNHAANRPYSVDCKKASVPRERGHVLVDDARVRFAAHGGSVLVAPRSSDDSGRGAAEWGASDFRYAGDEHWPNVRVDLADGNGRIHRRLWVGNVPSYDVGAACDYRCAIWAIDAERISEHRPREH